MCRDGRRQRTRALSEPVEDTGFVGGTTLPLPQAAHTSIFTRELQAHCPQSWQLKDIGEVFALPLSAGDGVETPGSGAGGR